MSTRRLQVVLDLDTGRYTGRLSSAASATRSFGGVVNSSSSSVRQFGRSFDSLNNSMSTPLQKLRDYVLILGNIRLAILNVRDIAVGWVGSLIQQSAQVERLMVLMKGLSNATTDFGKSQEAQRNMAMLFQEARRTGMAVDALADSFVKMKSGGLDPAQGGLKSLSNAVSTFGGNSDVMHRASIAIQQMAGKGVISMEELRQQLGEAVPTAMTDLARAMGMSVKDFTKLVGEGVVQAKPALELLFREWQIMYEGAGERMSATLTGQLGNFKTNMTEIANAFTGFNTTSGKGDSGGVYDQAVKGLQKLNEAMRSTEGRKFARDIGEAIGAIMAGIMQVTGFIVRFREEIGFALKVFLTGFLAVKAANIMQWLWGSIGTGITAMQGLANGTTQANGVIQSAMGNWSRQATQYSNVLQRQIGIQNARNTAIIREVAVTQNAAVGSRARLAALQGEQAGLVQKVAAERANIAAARQAQLQANANIATGTRLSASIQQAKNAKTQETLATIRLAQAERDLVVANGQVANASRVATAAATAHTAALTRQVASAGAATVAQRALSTAVAAGAATMRFFAAAVNLALGPLGMIALALYAAASAAGVFENKARAALQAARELRAGIATIENMNAVSSQAKTLNASVQADNDRIKAGGTWQTVRTRDGYERRFVKDSDATRAKIVKRMQGNTAQIKSLREDYAYGESQFAKQEGQNLANREQFKLDRATEDKRQAYLTAESNGASKAELDRLRQDYQDSRQRGAAAGMNSIEAMIKDAKAKGNDRQVMVLQGMRDQWAQTNNIGQDLLGTTEDLREAAVGAGEAGAAGGKKTGAALSDAQKAANALATEQNNAREGYADMIARLTGDIAKMKAEVGGAEGALAEFDAEVGAGRHVHILPEQMAKIREQLAEIDKLNSDADWGRSMRQLSKEVQQTTADANALWTALMADNTGKAFENYERIGPIRARFAQQLEEAAGDPDRLAEVNEKIDMVIRNVNRLDAAAAVNNWRLMAEDIELSLLNEDEARQRNFEREVERQQQLLDLVRNNALVSAEERQRAEERFQNWRRLREEQLRRENESSTTRMARDWAKLGQNIDYALGGALNNFVDGMMDAEFNFGDFAVSIIKDLVKIILKAMIAYAILSAIGMTHNSSGEKVGFGDFLKGQVGAGFGGGSDPKSSIGFGPGGAPKTVPTGHTGGRIGNLSGRATVDPSIFANAVTYHTGTNSIGGRALRPGEVPMIGMEGEAVLTEEHQQMISNRLRQKGDGSVPPVTVNVINNSDTQLEAEQGEPEFSGDEYIVNVVVAAANKEGPLRDTLANMGKN